jgi:hypothetical protein
MVKQHFDISYALLYLDEFIFEPIPNLLAYIRPKGRITYIHYNHTNMYINAISDDIFIHTYIARFAQKDCIPSGDRIFHFCF